MNLCSTWRCCFSVILALHVSCCVTSRGEWLISVSWSCGQEKMSFVFCVSGSI